MGSGKKYICTVTFFLFQNSKNLLLLVINAQGNKKTSKTNIYLVHCNLKH